MACNLGMTSYFLLLFFLVILATCSPALIYQPFVPLCTSALPAASVSSYINENGQSVAAAYQIVFNGLAIDPGISDIAIARKTLSQLPEVRAVFQDFAHQPDTYASLPLINAAAVWDQVGGQDNGGAGVKLASMDGGLHHDAAMFDGTGFNYPPGWPAGGLGDSANNNGKIIASRAYFRDWDPPSVGDENTWPGVNGTSHGTHTGSTAGGNNVIADYLGITETVSGVAPGAWLMSYRVFYNSITNDGSFYTVEGIAALEDIVADGADVVNNSWGGGPGSAGGAFDPLDQALINASAAGVFVSMSAGNAGPGNGTTDHPSNDYINVAASTTAGTFASGLLNVIAPTPISPTLQGLSYAAAGFGPPLPGGAIITHTYVTALSVDPANFEGCNTWAGTPFTGRAAIISRGSCEFGVKVLNAEQAGAEFVVVHNHAAGGDGLTTMGAGVVGNQVTIPSIFVGNTNGLAMTTWYAQHGNASVLEIDTQAFQAGNTPDIIAAFSSRGPGVGNVLKPDIAAPGVNILAQGYGNAVGEARHTGFGQVSGTSMAAPHVAGSAAMLRQVHPSWSNADIKSALMSTSKYMDIYNFDGSPAQPLDMGAGRLDLTNATDPGVILDPPSLSFGLMPTGTMATIHVNVHSVASASETYTLTTLFTGNGFAVTQTTDLPGFAISPASITLAPGESTMISVTFDSAAGIGIGDNQGYIIMAGDNGHDAHMAAWARVAPEPSADVLIIDNDFSPLLGFPHYLAYYTDALDNLGLTYDVWDADVNFANPTTIPEAAVLSAYDIVIYYTGDNFFPDGTFTVQTPLTALDMDRLTEFANNGGIIIAMGQHMSDVLSDSFFDDTILGDIQLQDSVSANALPDLPIVPFDEAPPAFAGIELDLSGADAETVFLSGANEVPPVATTTSGEATFTYVLASQELHYDITILVGDPITLTASHIHTGTAGMNGGVLHNLQPVTMPTWITDTFNYAGVVTLSNDEEAALLSDGLYVNVHTAQNPSGEVRGQVAAAIAGDGAGNQFFIDEMTTLPNWEPNGIGAAYPYQALLQYPGTNNMEDGVVAMAHRAQPSLENPGIAYYGRSIYTSFGLEGVNNGLGSTSREELLGTLLDWAKDEPVAVINDATGTYTVTGQAAVFTATLSSDIAGTIGDSYRWDFGDGTDFVGPYVSNTVGHAYSEAGTYTVRVEITDSLGNVAIGTAEVTVTDTGVVPPDPPINSLIYLPFVAKN